MRNDATSHYFTQEAIAAIRHVVQDHGGVYTRLGGPAHIEGMKWFSQLLGWNWPPSYLGVLEKHDGVLVCDAIFQSFTESFETFLTFHDTWQPRMYWPVAEDGCGNYWVLALAQSRGGGECPVLFLETVTGDTEGYIRADSYWILWCGEWLSSVFEPTVRYNGEDSAPRAKMAAHDRQIATEGWRLVRGSDHRSGIPLLQRACEITPSAMHFVGLGVAYLFVRDLESAIRHFDGLIERKPKHADKYYQLAGIARWLNGRPRDAAEVWRSGIGCQYTDGAGGVTMPLLLVFAAARHSEAFDMTEATNLLKRALQRSWAKNWPGPIGRFMVSEIDEGGLREKCLGVHALDTTTRHLKADFYVAVSKLAAGDRSEFVPATFRYVSDLTKVDPSGKEWNNEYHLAKYESELPTKRSENT